MTKIINLSIIIVMYLSSCITIRSYEEFVCNEELEVITIIDSSFVINFGYGFNGETVEVLNDNNTILKDTLITNPVLSLARTIKITRSDIKELFLLIDNSDTIKLSNWTVYNYAYIFVQHRNKVNIEYHNEPRHFK